MGRGHRPRCSRLEYARLPRQGAARRRCHSFNSRAPTRPHADRRSRQNHATTTSPTCTSHIEAVGEEFPLGSRNDFNGCSARLSSPRRPFGTCPFVTTQHLAREASHRIAFPPANSALWLAAILARQRNVHVALHECHSASVVDPGKRCQEWQRFLQILPGTHGQESHVQERSA